MIFSHQTLQEIVRYYFNPEVTWTSTISFPRWQLQQEQCKLGQDFHTKRQDVVPQMQLCIYLHTDDRDDESCRTISLDFSQAWQLSLYRPSGYRLCCTSRSRINKSRLLLLKRERCQQKYSLTPGICKISSSLTFLKDATLTTVVFS